MIQSFFLKRSFEIGFPQSKQYLDLSVGVSGDIDPETGMILNLSVLDSWFQDFRSKERAKIHENMLAFYETAKIFFQSKTKSFFALQIDWQQGTFLPMTLRFEDQRNHLRLRAAFNTGKNIEMSLAIQGEQDLQAILNLYQEKQNLFKNAADMAALFKKWEITKIETEIPILKRAFLESLD